MRVRLRVVAWFLVLAVALPGLVSAARKGRLVGRVVDPEGAPVEGVSVTATSKEVAGFEEVRVTDRKGTFILDFDRVNVTYHYRFEKVGYQVLETDQGWSLEGTARHDFVIYPGQAVTADILPANVSADPAIQAYNAGVAALQARDYATAQARFEEAAGHDPELAQAWEGLGVVHLQARRFQDAVDAAEKAIALGSVDEAVLRCRWEAYRALGDEAKTAQALTDLQTRVRLTEEAKKVHNEGVALAKVGDHEGAFAKFSEAARIDPTLQEALIGVTTEGLQVKRYEEVLAAARTLLEQDPQHEQALRVRYNAALGLGREDLIVEALVGLAPVEPTVARDGLLKLAYDAYDGNDLARAKDLFGKVLLVEPNQVQSHYLLALIAVSEGAKEDARRYLERFLQLAPGDAEAATARDLLRFLSQP